MAPKIRLTTLAPKAGKINRQKLTQLTDMAEEILSQIDNGAEEGDEGLKPMIGDWNSRVIHPQTFSDFRDFSSWTSANNFTRMAFNQEKFITDLIWGELIQIINFMYSAEGKESEHSQALDCWRTRLMPIRPTSSTGLLMRGV